MDIIIEALLGPFQYEFMLRALIVSVLVGVMCPILGVYVVIRGLGFMGDALAHSVLPRHGRRLHPGNQPVLRRHPHGHSHRLPLRISHQADRTQ